MRRLPSTGAPRIPNSAAPAPSRINRRRPPGDFLRKFIDSARRAAPRAPAGTRLAHAPATGREAPRKCSLLRQHAGLVRPKRVRSTALERPKPVSHVGKEPSPNALSLCPLGRLPAAASVVPRRHRRRRARRDSGGRSSSSRTYQSRSARCGAQQFDEEGRGAPASSSCGGAASQLPRRRGRRRSARTELKEEVRGQRSEVS